MTMNCHSVTTPTQQIVYSKRLGRVLEQYEAVPSWYLSTEHEDAIIRRLREFASNDAAGRAISRLRIGTQRWPQEVPTSPLQLVEVLRIGDETVARIQRGAQIRSIQLTGSVDPHLWYIKNTAYYMEVMEIDEDLSFIDIRARQFPDPKDGMELYKLVERTSGLTRFVLRIFAGDESSIGPPDRRIWTSRYDVVPRRFPQMMNCGRFEDKKLTCRLFEPTDRRE